MSTLAIKGNGFQSKLLWAAVIALGVVSFAIVALSRGEPVNAAWLVIAAVCNYFVAYRFYALFVANKLLGVDPGRQTPAYRHNDGLDYVPTNRYVLFGQIDRGDRPAAVGFELDERGNAGGELPHLSAGAEPDDAELPDGGKQSGRKAPDHRTTGRCPRHPIGYDDVQVQLPRANSKKC